MKRLIGCLAAAVLVLSGCAGHDPLRASNSSDGTLVVGSADFAESELLMNIYAEALAETGVDVQTRPRIGAREFSVPAVRQGELAVMPEYTGNLLEYVDPGAGATASGPVYAALSRELPRGLRVLRQSPAENSDVLTVSRETAAQGIHSLEELGPHCGRMVLAAPAEWKSRWADTIAEEYGCRFAEIRAVESSTVTVDALLSDQVQVANLFTTSAQIRQHDLVELADPREMFPAQHVVPLVRSGVLNERQVAALNRVSARLDTATLTELNRRLEVDKANPRDLAEEFLAGIR
ncbi:ABC transporter substrate-binding protein [Salinifilum ghardaiensis]